MEPMNIYKALELSKKHCTAKFVENIDLVLRMGLDPRRPEQVLKIKKDGKRRRKRDDSL